MMLMYPQLLKYGVVATEALCTDLRHWHQLYAAGRLQKPVLHVRCAAHMFRFITKVTAAPGAWRLQQALGLRSVHHHVSG